MHTTRLRKIGGAAMLAVPTALLDVLNLKAGAKVALAVDAGRLVVVPQAKPHYTLDELLAKCNPEVRRTAEERAWLDAKPVGRELL